MPWLLEKVWRSLFMCVSVFMCLCFQDHEEDCQEKLITCGVAGCTQEFPRKKVSSVKRMHMLWLICLIPAHYLVHIVT